MTVYYTTATLVKDRCDQIDTGSLSDTEIENIITMVEGVIDSFMKHSFRDPNSFNANKHGLIRDAATNLSAFYAVLHSIDNFGTVTEWADTLESLWARWEENRGMLRDSDVVKYLKSL